MTSLVKPDLTPEQWTTLLQLDLCGATPVTLLEARDLQPLLDGRLITPGFVPMRPRMKSLLPPKGRTYVYDTYWRTDKARDLCRHFAAPQVYDRYYFALGDRAIGPFHLYTKAVATAVRILPRVATDVFYLLYYTSSGFEPARGYPTAWTREEGISAYIEELWEVFPHDVFPEFRNHEALDYRSHRYDLEYQEEARAWVRMELNLTPDEAKRHAVEERPPGVLRTLALENYRAVREGREAPHQ